MEKVVCPRTEDAHSLRLWGDSQEVLALANGKHGWKKERHAATRDVRTFQLLYSKLANRCRAAHVEPAHPLQSLGDAEIHVLVYSRPGQRQVPLAHQQDCGVLQWHGIAPLSVMPLRAGADAHIRLILHQYYSHLF